jgi:hypothetical protein
VLDAWSRKVVGWSMANHLRAELVLDALEMAIGQRRPDSVIHHSDQGSQYTSLAFGNRCKEAGVRPSQRPRNRNHPSVQKLHEIGSTSTSRAAWSGPYFDRTLGATVRAWADAWASAYVERPFEDRVHHRPRASPALYCRA